MSNRVACNALLMASTTSEGVSGANHIAAMSRCCEPLVAKTMIVRIAIPNSTFCNVPRAASIPRAAEIFGAYLPKPRQTLAADSRALASPSVSGYFASPWDSIH